MKKILILAFALTFSAFLSQAFAQNIAGTYNMNFVKANQVYTDRTPASQSFTGSTTFEVTQNGDEITVTLQNFGGKWSTHIMKGRVGNNRLVAALASGTKSIYVMEARINGNVIEGEYEYIRYGDGNSGIVPGWTKVMFKAVKQ
ncbi:MAG: hypothetical protein KDE26_08810 [Bacteroidetes bacterium]|nr:hypothetical protein [Bacteroidota bacterium]